MNVPVFSPAPHFRRLRACIEPGAIANALAESLCVLSGAVAAGVYLRNYSGEALVLHGGYPQPAPSVADEAAQIPDGDLEDPLCLCICSAKAESLTVNAGCPASLTALPEALQAGAREITACPLPAPGDRVIGGALIAFARRDAATQWQEAAEILLLYAGSLLDACLERRKSAHLAKELRGELERGRPASSAAVRELTGNSEVMTRIRAVISRAAPTEAPVLITGETGTGKGLAARIIHESSGRGRRPFMEINCGALPSELLESELFGHVRGAFSGATADHAGLFRSAHGGTVFLDEIAEMPAALQSSLLHVLQEHSVRPVGSTHKYPVNIRIIAATNNDLRRAMELGRFRRDLYHRLAVVLLHMSPLRERREDIVPLARFFLERYRQTYGRPDMSLGQESLTLLRQHAFEGNVRELAARIERAVMLAPLECRTIDPELLFSCADEGRTAEASLDEQLAGFEAALLSEAWGRYGNNLQLCADKLGVHKKTLIRKLKRHALYGKRHAAVKAEDKTRGKAHGTHA